MNLEKLIEKSKSFEPDQELIDDSEPGRIAFITKFPFDSLKNMSVDQYVLGTDENSFCYWLEFKKILFGIGGGNASKFGLYKTDEGTYFTGYGKNKKQIAGSELIAFFQTIKTGILSALEYTKNDEIEKIRTIEIPLWNMVLQKILSLYFPEKFLTIGSPDVLIKCAKDIGIMNIDLKPANSIQINYECKKILSSLPEFKKWPYGKLGSFIWKQYDLKKPKDGVNTIQYWLYAPGENASKWEEFYERAVMCLGWDKLRDLRLYKSRNEIRQALIAAYGGEGSKMHDVSANDDFLNKVKVGDIVIAKKGRSELLGYGVVKSDYEYSKDSPDYKHIRKVDWKIKGNWKLDYKLALKTLTDITNYSTEHPGYNSFHDRLMGTMGQVDNSIDKKIIESISYPLNTIFYGPPGTGKTYNTIKRAAEIIMNRKIDSYDEALKIYKLNLHDRIEFITFHQNYSYEDFIQGLRPDTRQETEQLLFRKKDGIFKIIADRALENLRGSEKAPEEISRQKRFQEALDSFIEELTENNSTFKITENCQIFDIEEDAFRYTGDNWARHSNGIRMKFSDLTEFYLKDVQSRKDIKTLENISALAKQHATYYFGVYEGIKKKIQVNPTESQVSISKQNYVIIIDEINRANISRVFGELITLIESDKRSHGALPMEAKLPSGDTFIVPSNLYIIGTMNTADKSIALLDIALRRRFEFEPMYPMYTEDGLDVRDENILKSINQSIISDKGHDFQIGHSFFMDSKEDPYNFEKRMNLKVIPLLLEYFMNDNRTVIQILGKALSGTSYKIRENLWPLSIIKTND